MFWVGCLIVFVLMAYIALPVISDYYDKQGPGRITKNGITLHRKSPDAIRLSWGTGSGIIISPSHALSGLLVFPYLDMLRGKHLAEPLPRLTSRPGIWFFELESDSVYLGSVNPLNRGAEDRILVLWSLDFTSPTAIDQLYSLVAQDYIYLGYAVRNMDDVELLKKLVAPREDANLEENIVADGITLHRLEVGVERAFARADADLNELQEIRRSIPFMVERADPSLGHPCKIVHVLWLDGSIEAIPYGERFPATQEFMDAFRNDGL